MKKITTLLISLIFSFLLISCSKNSVDVNLDITHGTLKFEAVTTSGGITNIIYEIKDGSIELFKEGPLETSQSQWGISHPASSFNTYSIFGTPDLEELLTIKVFFDNVLIGSSTSLNGGSGNVIVVGTIP